MGERCEVDRGPWTVVRGPWSVVRGIFLPRKDTNDTNAGRGVVGFGEPRKTRKTRNVGVAEECSGEPSIVIGECFGCEFRNSFVSSDPSASGVARGSVVSGRWPIGGRFRGTPGTNAKTTLGLKSALQALRTNFWGCRRPRAAPWATGKRPFRPESQTQASRTNKTRP